MVYVRESNGTADVAVDLFSHDSVVVHATLQPTAPIRSCATERSAALSLADAKSGPPVWSLALATGIATPVAIEAVGELLPRDSAQLVARVSGLVSALPDDSTSAPFRGLPVVVRDAWRFVPSGDSAATVVAIATRTLNTESNPRSEAVIIVAEPDPTAGGGNWRTVFARRDAGPEDRIEGADLLAALKLRNSHVAIALARENDAGSHVDIVERTAPGTWRVRWSSMGASCGR